jgi:hypothetical protein
VLIPPNDVSLNPITQEYRHESLNLTMQTREPININTHHIYF